MSKRPIASIALVSCCLVVGFLVGAYSQTESNPFEKLAAERANISKVDWILLNTRIRVLEETHRWELPLSFTPTSYSYDLQKQRIRVAIFVDPTWFSKHNVSQASEEFSKRADRIRAAVLTAEHGQLYSLLGKDLTKYYSIIFFTGVLDESGKSASPKDLAIYEDGKLTLR